MRCQDGGEVRDNDGGRKGYMNDARSREEGRRESMNELVCLLRALTLSSPRRGM